MKQNRFRIYTENKNCEGLQALVGTFFKGFTIFEAQGFYKGELEGSLVIEIIAPIREEIASDIEFLGSEICHYNDQERVLITKEEVEIL